MRCSALAAFAAFTMCAPAAIAQTSGNEHMEHHSEMHQCMMQHLGGLHAEVKAHMEAFRAANPSATGEARKAERHSFMEQVKQAHMPEIKAAHMECHKSLQSSGSVSAL